MNAPDPKNTQDNDLTKIDPRTFRNILGSWPSGVVVITGYDGNTPVGMSCNAFSSVSLDPPLVGFFPAVTSSTWPKIRASGHFVVNILAAHHEEVSRAFARKDVDRFAGTDTHDRQIGRGIDEAVAWIDCEIYDEVEAGDHTLVLGLVQNLETTDGGEPLVFHRGQYAEVNSKELSTAAR